MELRNSLCWKWNWGNDIALPEKLFSFFIPFEYYTLVISCELYLWRVVIIWKHEEGMITMPTVLNSEVGLFAIIRFGITVIREVYILPVISSVIRKRNTEGRNVNLHFTIQSWFLIICKCRRILQNDTLRENRDTSPLFHVTWLGFGVLLSFLSVFPEPNSNGNNPKFAH